MTPPYLAASHDERSKGDGIGVAGRYDKQKKTCQGASEAERVIKLLPMCSPCETGEAGRGLVRLGWIDDACRQHFGS